jgi:hypothetical protein
MGICKMCGIDKKLIKAHIIPKAFFKEIANPKDDFPKIYSNDDYPRKAPIGIYDENILCEDCEKKFKEIDDYAVDFFIEENYEKKYYKKKYPYVFNIAISANNKLLKLFAISLLWRGSVSKQPFYSDIQLGPFEEKAKELLINYEMGEKECFATSILEYTGRFIKIFNPYRKKIEGVNIYRIFLGKYGLLIKVDKQIGNSVFNETVIPHKGDFLVMKSLVENSQEIKIAKEIARYSRDLGFKNRIKK